ncbi:hypothetical protein [Saccharothrix ecbatanensis]|uniref:hypothetical protein n=1 Tax=Saccharothrix ecbatanensis TaxID=1105145 RepID=UPI0035E4270D
MPNVEVSEVPVELPEGKVLLDVHEADEWEAGHAARRAAHPDERVAEQAAPVRPAPPACASWANAPTRC